MGIDSRATAYVAPVMFHCQLPLENATQYAYACKKSARCNNAMVSPVESIRLNARCLFHVGNTSPRLSVLSTALDSAVLSIPANCHVARQLKIVVPHASIDATDSTLCKACQPNSPRNGQNMWPRTSKSSGLSFFIFHALPLSLITRAKSFVMICGCCTGKSCEKVALPVLHDGFHVIAFLICRTINALKCSTFFWSSSGLSSRALPLVDDDFLLASNRF